MQNGVISGPTPGPHGGSRSSPLDVALVSMPFGILEEPAIALGLLKASLRGPTCKTLYFTLRFAERVEPELYNWIASGSRPLSKFLGEHFFRSAAFPESDWRDSDFWDRWIDETEAIWITKPEGLDERLEQIREWVDPFLAECLEEIRVLGPRIVGFTSVFQQQLASLALARKIKEAFPDTFIVFGGANCEGKMGREMVRQFEFIDAVVSGEGEIVFPRLVDRVLANKGIDDLPGVFSRGHEGAVEKPQSAPRVASMDELPIPDYGDFFEAWQRTTFGAERRPRLPYETSRGCWWGEKMHCTFCGLNGEGMAFRSKSGERALSELRGLLETYPVSRVQAVDNILDMRYFKSFIPSLAEEEWEVRLFYEVKANLTKEHLRQLYAAGITEIQPGIESLSTHVLQVMGKGVTMLQNVRLLKWCQEIGVEPVWNILWGFPEERPSDYEEMAQLIPWLCHLKPPIYAGQLRLDRFSPNFEESESLGFVDVKPDEGYSQLYPLDNESLANLAYYFDFAYGDGRDVESYTRLAREAIIGWRRDHKIGALTSVRRGQATLVLDQRPAARRPMHLLTGQDAELLEACDGISHRRHLHRLKNGGGVEELEKRLASLVERGLLLQDGDSYLSLPVRRQLAPS